MKKIILIVLLLIAAAALVFAGWYFSNKNTTVPPAPSNGTSTVGLPPIATSTPGDDFPTGDTFSIATPDGGVTVRNFYKNPAEIAPDKESIMVTSVDSYDISYYRPDSSFAIVLLRTPIAAARTEAEAAFLEQLGISAQDACKLSVTVQVPVSVDPENAGINLGLSFCSARIQ